ncbi:hypothetical protein TVAG_341060 [Trichomonas vaginalis G3]|uniref:Uncharacterized protein n=1 Tax=Trichomonas vaginalis (strain ATCC PRA-98 / G3) TaxID=412133 RepID=A2DTR5_TRIV3|nr:armadillo (ARM) repeat-containing protein family [Trichomonas vaginalis G3]EAY16212.1 hypothetical protein TVAG_341060 [Trichomonas vaginalis G3]KAI5493288.1 armadillo (ARM) repeat-containing protein family [Trichomonas vaginalis G3]|eukprot:XP_001328435.1 hypothetical protein [Trichomonas vaginalis G3]
MEYKKEDDSLDDYDNESSSMSCYTISNLSQLFLSIKENYEENKLTKLAKSLQDVANAFRANVFIDESFVGYDIPSILYNCASIGEESIETHALLFLINIISSNEPYYFHCLDPENVEKILIEIFRSRIYHANFAFKILTNILDKDIEFSLRIFSNISPDEIIFAAIVISESCLSSELNSTLLINNEVIFLEKIIRLIPLNNYYEIYCQLIDEVMKYFDINHPQMVDYFRLLNTLTDFDQFKEYDEKYHFGLFMNQNLENMPYEITCYALAILASSAVSPNEIKVEQIYKFAKSSVKNIQQSALYAIGKLIFCHNQLSNIFYRFFSIEELIDINQYDSKIKLEVIYILTAFSRFCTDDIRHDLMNAGAIEELLEYADFSDFSDEIAIAAMLLLKKMLFVNGIEFTQRFVEENNIMESLSDLSDSTDNKEVHELFDQISQKLFSPDG